MDLGDARRTGLYLPFEVAELFDVSLSTVHRWGSSGVLPMRRTLGGHRRFIKEAVDRKLVNGWRGRDA